MTDKKEIAEINYAEYAEAGNENLTSDDYQIPHIKILEKTSPTLEEIDGTKAGQIFLSSREESVDSVYFVPLHYITVYSVWSEESQDKILATFQTKDEAKNFIEASDERATVAETGQNLLLLLDENLDIDHPAMMYLSKSRLSVNKAFNTRLKVNYPPRAPRFAGVWNLGTKKRSNTKGNWYVPKFDFISLCTKKFLDEVNEIYKDVAKNLVENTFILN